MKVHNAQGQLNMVHGLNAFHIIQRDGSSSDFDEYKIIETIRRACIGFEQSVNVQRMVEEVRKNIFHGITIAELEQACIMAACSFIEYDPAYGKIAARLLLWKLAREILGVVPSDTRFCNALSKIFCRNNL